MNLQKLPLTAVPFERRVDDSLIATPPNEQAEHYLSRCFATRQPLAVVTDPRGSMSAVTVRRFLSSVDEAVTVIRVEQANRENVLAAMQQIIRGIGFDPGELTLVDLESVLVLFLQHQRTKDVRTIIFFEHVGEDEPWLLYYLSRLLTIETENEFGLLVIVAGQTAVGEQLRWTTMQGDRVQTSEHFNLAPLRESETLELLRHEIEACGAAEVGSVFEFKAVQQVHELTGGIPDAIRDLCRKSLELACERDTVPVSPDVVQECARYLGLLDAHVPELDLNAETDCSEWLIIRDDAQTRSLPLIDDRLVIGRGGTCDIQLVDNWATREHAVLLRTKRGIVIVDLLSTNGTYVRSKPVIRQCLNNHDVISIGTSELIYRTEQPLEADVTDDEPATDQFEIPVLNQALG